jgi:hypothetical protein
MTQDTKVNGLNAVSAAAAPVGSFSTARAKSAMRHQSVSMVFTLQGFSLASCIGLSGATRHRRSVVK